MDFSLFGAYIGDNFCSEQEVITLLRIAGYVVLLIRLFIPIVIIAIGTIDFYKAVIGGNQDAVKKNLKALGFRVLIGLFVAFLPALINSVLNQLQQFAIMSSEYEQCQTCLFHPTDC